ncbi:MAG TPA: ClpXP protease specificity-enhancing factor [Gammaproteobacteria bacterium]|nr:ClpXP protease specificity-enhancing factor [Gammaproteobacteria bacterium]
MTEESLSTQPYLIRALWQWANDSGLTPQLLVDAEQAGVQVPASSVQDGKIVLNISNQAAKNLDLGDEMIHFSARFGGVVKMISLPVTAVRAIFARENGQGMVFDILPTQEPPNPVEAGKDAGSTRSPTGKSPGVPELTVVK